MFYWKIDNLKPLPAQPLPPNPRRIVLLNPTKYLGNLLIAGGLMQRFAAHCRAQNRELLIVLDASFQELCAAAFADVPVLWYPRQELRRAGPWRRLRLFAEFMRRLRAFRPDLAFNLEEDSLSSRLTQFSGAAFRLGCSPARHRFGYEHVLPIDHGAAHRWYGFQAVFSALGVPADNFPCYINLFTDQCDERFIQKLYELGVDRDAQLVAIHPAATKEYKKWPESAFSELCKILIEKGYSPVLLGAGAEDAGRCTRISKAVASDAPDRAAGAESIPAHRPARLYNLCNQLSLAELASLFRRCVGIVGNDSGPSHLAATQGLPGVVIFGPSDPSIWGPLGTRSRVIRKVDQCDPRCSRRACFADYRCLRAISPQDVLDTLLALIETGNQP
ncbi:MAG: glycosyltransferase family 9 protein [Pseudomonadota bacterium]|nr:glycosyltransferase family 9 protein [Pseudomonadota bacterium]